MSAMRLILRASLLFFFLIAVSILHAQSRIDCTSMQSRILQEAVHYCVLLPAGYDAAPQKRYPILYYLHGLGENEQTLFKSGGWNIVQDLRQQNKIGDFLIATPEAKASFYINSADGKVRYSDFFMQEFLPRIERKYRVRPGVKSRAISWVSMGGYGAFRFAFAYPNMFSAVSAQSAAFMTDTPQQLDAAMRSRMPLTGLLAAVFGDPIQIAHWKANSVFELARSNRAAIASLAIYFNCGQQDDFGFEAGAAALDKELQSEKIAHQAHLYPGGHDAEYFLGHLAEVMQFHSKNFGLSR